ncbi:Oxysterol-binding protein 3 [Coemansia sp. RSA 922]|nr:Oxysterol-binding protein 3 [Coemansia sp. RSA 922]
MEEIEILPRDAYLHTVYVSQAPCTIQWWFSTKRKNIDFGLFQRRPQSTIGDDISVAGSIGPAGSTGSTTGTSSGKRLVPAAGLSWQQSESDVRAAGLPRTPAEVAAKQRSGQLKLHERNSVELMPLKHYESSKSTIKGFWNAVDPGAYVLYFDNSFSKNTSKRLSFCVAVKEAKEGNSKPPVLMSGWLLKKKRKRMQGWANRWFSIQGHWLLYSTTEGGVSRAKIDLVNAVISISKEDRAITVDSDEGFMQLRAQTDADFTAWVAALQMTKEQAAAAVPPSIDAATEGATLAPGMSSQPVSGLHRGAAPSDAQAATQRIDMKRVQRVHASFEDSVEQLQGLFNEIQEPSRSELRDRAMRYLRLIKDNGGALYTLLASLEGAGRPALARKDTAGSSSIGRPSISLVPSHASWLSGSGSDIFYDTNEMVEFTPDNDSDALPLVGPTTLATLERATQSSSSMSPSTNMETPPSRTGLSARCGDADSMSDSEDDENGYFGSHVGTGDSPQFGRMRRDLIRDPDFNEAFARNHIQAPLSPAIVATVVPGEADDTSESQSLDLLPLVTLEKARLLLGAYEPRTTLPAETCEANVSLISILRKNVGKELSNISMPLVMNEPINTLQSLCEELMYSRLLQRADEMGDSLDRLMYVAAFAISTLSSKKYRAERKPFNPLLGETYEMVDSLGGYRFVSEKVSHHPPVMACYADSPFFRFWQDSSVKSKFWGKSMELIQTSNVNIELLKHADHFTYCKPSALVRGLISGNRSVDFTGEMSIVNHATGDSCSVHFKEAGVFTSSNDMVECHLRRGGTPQVERVLRGSWSSHMRFEKSTTDSDVLWTAVSLPPDAHCYYGFSYFAMHLNELTPATQKYLPTTDTRFRPDQRAYEEGRIDDAEQIKQKLEEAQRTRKRERDESAFQWKAQWFEEREDPQSPTGRSWQYRGGYWDARAKNTYPPALDLW